MLLVIVTARAVEQAPTAGPGAADAALESLWRSKDQALIDETTPGDRAMWEATLAPGAVTVDENGRTLSRQDMLSELAEKPPGITLTTTMTDYRLSRWGDTATVIHTDAETETFHGQVLHSVYLTTETWTRSPDGWHVALIHIFAVPKDPPGAALAADALEQYAGRYAASADLVYAITFSAGGLLGAREGKPGVPLLAELKDVLFIKGQPRTRKIFQRDAAGRITGFVDRREGTDVVWRRIDTDRTPAP